MLKLGQLLHFLPSPSPVKLRGGLSYISESNNEGSSMTEPSEYIWWSSPARLLRTVYLFFF